MSENWTFQDYQKNFAARKKWKFFSWSKCFDRVSLLMYVKSTGEIMLTIVEKSFSHLLHAIAKIHLHVPNFWNRGPCLWGKRTCFSTIYFKPRPVLKLLDQNGWPNTCLPRSIFFLCIFSITKVKTSNYLLKASSEVLWYM